MPSTSGIETRVCRSMISCHRKMQLGIANCVAYGVITKGVVVAILKGHRSSCIIGRIRIINNFSCTSVNYESVSGNSTENFFSKNLPFLFSLKKPHANINHPISVGRNNKYVRSLTFSFHATCALSSVLPNKRIISISTL